ncbi:MAG: methyltransferase domain-containing protein [Prolixibacteraceae bacterium]|jgi:ubiquinone/menaquinone biosynthesis C-methylase UbiE|nr:methyltransferase domain-containing protein [Prolixibacteraceae bacterium]
MSSFDNVAREWDKDKMHMERSVAIAATLESMVALSPSMKAMEFGAGTGILSFLLKDKLKEITLIDSSSEMIKVCEEKIAWYKVTHLKTLCIDLEHADYKQTIDLIYSQMVLHHVIEIEPMLKKFFSLLNSGGTLAIADLYREDGSFHGPEVKVHWGFDPEDLKRTASAIGFRGIEFKTCFEMKRESGRIYPIFLLVAKKL